MELADKRRDLMALQAGIDRFPSGMDRLRGNERSRIREIDDEIAELETSIDSRRRELEEAEHELAENELPQGTVDEDILRIEDERVQRLERLAREREGREEELKLSEGVMRAAGSTLGIRAETPPTSGPDELKLDDVDSWARKAIRLKDRRQSLEIRLTALPTPADVDREEVERVRRAGDLLCDWLSSPGAAISSRHRQSALRLVGSLAVLAGGLLAILINPWFILLGGFGLGILLMNLLPGELEGDKQALFREQFEELDLPPLISWKRTEVRARLRELGEELRQGEKSLADETERGRLQGELRILEEETRLIEEERAEICRVTGLDPAATELSIIDFVDRLKSFREASRITVDAAIAASIAGEKYEEELKKVRDFLSRTLGKVPEDDLDARHLMASLKEKSGRLRNARFRLTTAEKEMADRGKTIAKKQTRIERIFQLAGIKPAVRPAADRVLDEMLDRLDEYREKTQRAESLQAGVSEREAQLTGRDDLLELDRPEAELRLEEVRRREKQRDNIVGRIQQIRDRIDAAVAGNAQEEALAEVEAAHSQLEDRYAEALAAAAGRLLLEKAEEEYEEQSRPAVLDRAARWFSAFTRAQYELLVSGDPGSSAFRAQDTSTGRGIGLDELSDGTRVQLLLATRLAFATQAEPGGPLPLFLDEALTTSDPDRFRAIAESLIVLASEGRQLFYLTSNPSDAEFFLAICRNVNERVPNLIDLGRIREISAGSERDKLSPPEIETIPAPGKMIPEEYGEELRVPLFDPAAPATACHLFYLLYDDLKLLYIIIRDTGVRTVGQWRSFLRGNPEPPGLAPEETVRVNDLAAILELFISEYSVGRGKPIYREVLEASGEVSSRYISPFTGMLRELRGDGRKFMELLETGDDPRTARFPNRKKQALRAYLEENEFIDSRESLTIEEITAAITARSEILSRISPEDIIYQISGLWARANRRGGEDK
jgi:hypothetical protein